MTVNFFLPRHNRYKKLLLPCLLGRPWGLIWFLGIWAIGAAELQAAPEDFANRQILERPNATSVAEVELSLIPHDGVGATPVPLNKQLIAAPENLQPS